MSRKLLFEERTSIVNFNILNKVVLKEEECSICLDNINDVLYFTHDCEPGHGFHRHCLMDALNKDETCPYCRKQATQKNEAIFRAYIYLKEWISLEYRIIGCNEKYFLAYVPNNNLGINILKKYRTAFINKLTWVWDQRQKNYIWNIPHNFNLIPPPKNVFWHSVNKRLFDLNIK